MQDAINHITREPYAGKNQRALPAYAAANGAPEFVTPSQPDKIVLPEPTVFS